MTHHKRSTGNLIYRYNPETKRIQFWDTYSDRSRWSQSSTFPDTYVDTRTATEIIRRHGYKTVTIASTFCEPDTYRTGA